MSEIQIGEIRVMAAASSLFSTSKTLGPWAYAPLWFVLKGRVVGPGEVSLAKEALTNKLLLTQQGQLDQIVHPGTNPLFSASCTN